MTGKQIAALVAAPIVSTVMILMTRYAFDTLAFYLVCGALASIGVVAYFQLTTWPRRAAGMLFAFGASAAIGWQSVVVQAVALAAGVALIAIEAFADKAPATSKGASVKIATGNKAKNIIIDNVTVRGVSDAQIAADNEAAEDLRISKIDAT